MAPLRVLLVLAVWLTAAQLRAQAEPAIEVAWNAKGVGEPCAKPAGVEAEVSALAGSAAAQDGAQFSVEIEALPEGRQRLSVARRGTNARDRELASCAEAREAAVLIMATALGAETNASETPTEPSEESASASVVAEMGVAPRFTLTLSALLDVFTLPGVGAGPALSAGYAHGLLRAGVSLRYLPARAAPDVPSGASIRIDSFAGSVHAGALFRFATTAFGPRAELELGNLRGRAGGAVEDKVTQSTFYAALLAGAELELWLHSRIGLSLVVLAGPALRRPRFALADNIGRYTSERLVLRAGLGITVRITSKD